MPPIQRKGRNSHCNAVDIVSPHCPLTGSGSWETLTRSIDFMQARLGIQPPYTVEFGGAGLIGYSLAITIDSPYEIRDDVFSETFVLTDRSRAAIDSALLRIFSDAAISMKSGLFETL